MRTEVVHNLGPLIERYRGARKAIHQRWRKSLYALGAEAIRYIKRDPRGAGETTATATAVRTGRLRNSYSHEVSEDGGGLMLSLGVIKPGAEALKYAAIHEFGGEVRAKSGQYLAIPLPAARTDRGVTRASPRMWPDTFVFKGRAGSPVIMQKQAGGGVLPLFVLKRSVRIKARPALEPARVQIEPKLIARLREDAVDVIAEVA